MGDYIQLHYWQVAMASLLIIFNGAISLFLRLGMGRQLLIASARTVAQLWLVGLVLAPVFEMRNPFMIMLLMALMTVVAGLAASRRTSRRYSGIGLNTLVSVWCSSWLITILALVAIVQVRPWYLPQYSIPFLGMILGNTLNGISIGLDRLGEELVRGRDQIETILALGGTRWEAAHRPVSSAVRTGMIPVINSMTVVGIVSLPGMMTGQLLSGVEPIDAVKYQIVIMFLIAAGTALGTVAAVLLGYRRLFAPNHQFLYDRIANK